MRALGGFLVLAVLSCGCSGTQEGGDSEPESSVSSELATQRLAQARERFSAKNAAKPLLRAEDGALRFGVSQLDVSTADNRTRSLRLTLPSDVGDLTKLHDVESGVGVGFRLLGTPPASASAIVDGIIVSPRVFPGVDSFVRGRADGLEDYVSLEAAPSSTEVRYELVLEGVAGLRQIGQVIEFLDPAGAPRLRVTAPAAVDAEQRNHALRLELQGCAVDRDPRGPWGRPVLPPGNTVCELAVRWDGDVKYP
ncbi:MAG: hypothetical protein AB7S68_41980, partial [Polyangiaceae bacterium]